MCGHVRWSIDEILHFFLVDKGSHAVQVFASLDDVSKRFYRFRDSLVLG
jgi:hypothetical protein